MSAILADAPSLPRGIGVGFLAFIFLGPFVIAAIVFAVRKLRRIRRDRMRQDGESPSTENQKG
jgi:hypothetical protein